MKSRNKIKNSIINICLIVALAMSILGGIILYPKNRDTASAAINGIPQGLDFISQNTAYNATGYNNVDGFIPENSNFNYIENLGDLVYYLNGSKLYTDHAHTQEAMDLIYSKSASSITARKRTDDRSKNKTYALSGDGIYLVEYQGYRLYWDDNVDPDKKKLYNNLSLTEESGLDYIYNEDSHSLYFYSASDSQEIEYDDELINKYFSIDGNDYYIDNNELYSDKVYKLPDGGVFHDTPINTGDYYIFDGFSGGYQINSNSISVLYQYDTTITETADIPATGESDVEFVKITEDKDGTFYYIRQDRSDNFLYTISSGSATKSTSNLLEFTKLYNHDHNNTPDNTVDDNTYAVINYPYQSFETASVQAQFKFDSTDYYVINSRVCEKTGVPKITSTSGKIYSQGADLSGTTEETYTINKNTTKAIEISSESYYPIEIWGEKYYVKDGNNSNLYTINRTSSGYTLTTTRTSFDDIVSDFTNNEINITITFKGKYYVEGNIPYKLNSINLNGRDNFIVFSETYYYNNAKLYLSDPNAYTGAKEDIEVKDFDYTCDLTTVLYNNIYYDIESASFKYVVINGTTYYVDGSDLYTNIDLGGDNEVSYIGKVNNKPLAYRLNTIGGTNIITVFDTNSLSEITPRINPETNNVNKFTDKSSGTSIEIPEIIDTTKIIGVSPTDTTILGIVEDNSESYLVTKDGSLYQYHNGYYINFYNLNFNYEITYDVDGKASTVEINNQDISSSLDTTNTSYYTFEYNDVDYYIANESSSTHKLGCIYIDIVDTSTGTDSYNSTDPTVLTSELIEDKTNKTYSSNGLRDYLFIKNADGNPQEYYFADSTLGNEYTVLGDDDSTSADDVVYEKSGTTLVKEGSHLEFSKLNFQYEIGTDSAGNNTVNATSQFDVNETKFKEYKNNLILDEGFNYIQSTDNGILVINTQDYNLYKKINYDYTHTPTLGPQETNITVNASSVEVKGQTGKPYDIQSNVGKAYNNSLLAQDNISSGGIVLLNNFATKNEYLTASTSGTTVGTKSVNAFYIAINRPNVTSTTPPTAPVPIEKGINDLKVDVYLKNDYVTKYQSITDNYYTHTNGEVYGIRLVINDIVEESVIYTGIGDAPDINMYWFDYFDLTNIKAIINYDSANGDKVVTEKVQESSGLYTFVFNFTYVDGSSSTAYEYVYQVYLSENSDYIEFPTFNTNLYDAGSKVNDDDNNIGYYTVTKLINNGYEDNNANGQKDADEKAIDSRTYSYNNQRYDLPMYIYDATKYNVGYSFSYGLTGYEYTTNFSLANVGTNDEYGVFEIYKNSILETTYTLYTSSIVNTDSSDSIPNGTYNIVDYYNNSVHYGSLVINPSGNYYLSLEDFYYYNPTNYDPEDTKLDWLLNGRLIKNGAENTPLSYYMVLIFDELGDYTFTHRYLVSKGNISLTNTTGEFEISDQIVTDALYLANPYGISDGTITYKIFNSEILRFGEYNYNGEFVINSSLPGTLETSTESPIFTKLKYYGLKSTFTKNGTQLDFRKLDENIYSDVTGRVATKKFASSDSDPTDTKEISQLTSNYKGKLYFNTDDDNFNIPFTNLQPVYFEEYGVFNYNDSKYYRYQYCNYETDENGMLKSINFNSSTMSTVKFKMDDISDPGFYILEVKYGLTDSFGDTSYFMFVIDNNAPVLKINTHSSPSAKGELFISTLEVTKTSRFTNTNYVSANWNNPNYFQGEIKLGYEVFPYNTVSKNYIPTVDATGYSRGNIITTSSNGEYVFTIWYGVNSLSCTSTYIIVDKTTPTGELYGVNSDDTVKSTTPIKNVFNTKAVFSSLMKKASNAPIYARYAIISLDNYDNSAIYDDATTGKAGKVILNGSSVEAIATNYKINADNYLFGDEEVLDNCPKYALFDYNRLEAGVKVETSSKLGDSSQSLIYIIKLCDEAGNYNIYYYFYDNTKPDMIYQQLPSNISDTSNFINAFENNITQTNANIIWGNYKAIPIEGNVSNSLFSGFVNALSDTENYNGLSIKTHNDKNYLYVPISEGSISSDVALSIGNYQKVTATTTYPNFSSRTTIFVDKNNDDRVLSYNLIGNYKVTIANNEDFNSLYSNKYINIFKGDKKYTFTVKDASGNGCTEELTLNSSVAQETFYLNTYDIHDSTILGYANPEKNQAYNADSLKLSYIDLSESQSFYAKITYDYYAFDFNKYLKNEGDTTSENVYNEFGYNTVTGEVYRYSETTGNFHLCSYDNGNYTLIPDSTGFSLDELDENIVFPGYPFALSNSNLNVNVNSFNCTYKTYDSSKNEYVDKNIDTDNNINATLNPINFEKIGSSSTPATKSGLYVFRRSYVNTDGTEVTQANIDTDGNDIYNVLSNDYAVRYHIFYIDRNGIISLNYNSSGDLDEINSIGDLLEIYLGQKLDDSGETLKYEKDAVINSETLSALDGIESSKNNINITKLAIETNFTIDKYATEEKLNKYRRYNSSNAFNLMMEELSIITNANLFKYNINITRAGSGSNEEVVTNNNIVASDIEKVDTSNYSIKTNGTYNLTIADTSTFDKSKDIDVSKSNNSNIEANSLNFTFGITRMSPQGQFISKADDEIGSTINLSTRNQETNASGHNITYKSSNANNLSFTFSESSNKYDATINPYQVEVRKDGKIIFATAFRNSGSAIDKFGNSTKPANANITDILKIDTSSAYKKYTINIFDKNSTVPLLSKWEDDATYTVKVNFVGNPEDYTVGDSNYYTTIHTIHIDRKAPQSNFDSIASKDPNLNDYCLDTYGFNYSMIKASDPNNYNDLINTYAFPIRIIEDENLEYYYKKTNPNSNLTDIDPAHYGSVINKIYEDYSTLLTFNYDESVKIYYRPVDGGPREYAYTILPNDPKYEEGMSGHYKFTESSTYFQSLTNVNSYNYFGLANLFIKSGDDKLNYGYYELIEQDEAGNLTRYFTYISDNTNVEAEIEYITSEEDKFDTASTEKFNTNYYIMYDNTRLYVCDPENNGTYALYKKEIKNEKAELTLVDNIDGITPEIICSNYYSDVVPKVASGTEYKFITIPETVTIGGTTYKINDTNNPISGLKTINSAFNNIKNPLGILNLTGINIVKYCETTPESNYIFDDFYTIKFYSVDTSETLIMSQVRNPYKETNVEFLQRVVDEFQKHVDDKSDYSYKLEIVNRFDDNYVAYFDLPDTELDLSYTTTANGNLLVTIPDFSQYNSKIKRLSIFYYQDHEWHPLIQDANGKIIQTSNIIDSDAGLPSTTYELSAGQYRFYIADNFDRSTVHYEIVGSNYNSDYEFQYEKSHIVSQDGTLVTSGSTLLMIDDNVWQVQVILKDAVTLYDSTNTFTFSLRSQGNETFLVNDENKQLYIRSDGSIDRLVSYSESGTTFPIFYSMGKLYYNNGAENKALDNIAYNDGSIDYTCSVSCKVVTSNNLIYNLGSSSAGRKCYIINPYNTIDEYKIIINWITDAENSTIYNLKIDRNNPVVHLTAETGSLEVMNNQSYYNPFTMSWTCDYKIVNARLIKVIDGIRSEVDLTNRGEVEINQIGGYTLFLTDEIGNQLSFVGFDGKTSIGFSFEFVEEANEYFSVYVGVDEDNLRYLAPSNYILTASDGKSIRHYYFYDTTTDGNFATLIQTDETKYIKAYKVSDASSAGITIATGVDADYVIVRSNINYIICYIKIVGVAPTEDIKHFLDTITFNSSIEGVSTAYNASTNTYMLNQDYDSFTLTVNTNLYGVGTTNNVTEEKYVGNKIIVNHYYNGEFIRSYSSDYWMSWTTSPIKYSNSKFNISISTTGVHEFEFTDSLINFKNISGNVAKIGNSNRIKITLIKDIMFKVNDLNPIDYQIFNSNVVINAPETDYYNNIQLTATLNEKAISTDALKKGSLYTFTESGVYQVTMTASDSDYTQYTSVYNFTIINPNVSRMTFGLGSNYGFVIDKVLKNQADITEKYTSKSLDSIWLTSGEEDTVGNYTITLLGYDKIINDYRPFTFTVRLNNEVPSISAVNYEFGTSTKKAITLQFNPALIYSQVGEAYIQVINENGEVQQQIDIDSTSTDTIQNLVINSNGKFNITIFNKDGNFIANYTVTKVAPLNTSAKIIIIVISIVAVALTVVFIILRRHTKFR